MENMLSQVILLLCILQWSKMSTENSFQTHEFIRNFFQVICFIMNLVQNVQATCVHPGVLIKKGKALPRKHISESICPFIFPAQIRICGGSFPLSCEWECSEELNRALHLPQRPMLRNNVPTGDFLAAFATWLLHILSSVPQGWVFVAGSWMAAYWKTFKWDIDLSWKKLSYTGTSAPKKIILTSFWRNI